MADRGMSWIRVDVGFGRHPKADDLRIEMGDHRAPYYVTMLWAWAGEFFPDGILRKSYDQIERAAGWKGKRGALIAALVRTGYLDAAEQVASESAGSAEVILSIHGWGDHNGAVHKRMVGERDRVAQWREKAKNKTVTKEDGRTETVQYDNRTHTEQVLNEYGTSNSTDSTVRNETENKIKNPPNAIAPVGRQATFFSGGKPTPPDEPPKKTRRKPRHEQLTAEQYKQRGVDGDRWKAAYCDASGTSVEDFGKWGNAWHPFAVQWFDRGIDNLLLALKGAASDPWYRGKGPAAWLANDAIIKGLNAAKGVTASKSASSWQQANPPPDQPFPEGEFDMRTGLPIDNR